MPIVRSPCLLLGLSAAALSCAAQTPPADQPPPTQRVEITGGRTNDTEQRRQSTAAKIVIGRDEIERMGDSTVGEILKRLPGVTLQGAPGRGGAIRMRGLGGGYTQILLDGQRVPPGFSLDSMNPEQIERIEILRAPTAETGARAIAGTINIVTREGFSQRLNDLRLSTGVETGRLQPGVAWTRNGGSGPFSFNLSLSANHNDRDSASRTTTTDTAAGGTPTLVQREDASSRDRRNGLHLTGRLQWRPDEQGDLLMLMPLLIHSQGSGLRDTTLHTLLGTPQPGTDRDYDSASTDSGYRFSLARLNGQWRHRLADGTRLELQGGAGLGRSRSHSLRREFTAGLVSDEADDQSTTREASGNLNLKASKLLADDHSLVGGAEVEAAQRHESALRNGAPVTADGSNLQASSRRLALYAQDEWSPNAHWAAHAGLRWEGILTRSAGSADNRSSVVTPLLHAVWKPDPKGRDQLRMSLTRSYKSPTLQNLIARPQVALHNSETSPDRIGNPALKPELATGVDVAVEHYFAGGGLLSANVFHRNIRDLIRTLTTQQAVPWSTQPRWVASPANIGSAMTQGLELEAKFRLDELRREAPPLDLRANLSLFRSRVAGVPAPDNRLDQQPGATANLGADYRLRGLPLTVGGNLNWTPGYDTRLSAEQSAFQGRKRVVDAYALWRFNSAAQLRVSASNLAPLDYETASSVADPARGTREIADTVARSYLNWQLQLELRL